MKEKTYLRFVELGNYIQRFQDDVVIHLISDEFYLSATILELKTTLRSLLKFEVFYVDLFPYTLYL